MSESLMLIFFGLFMLTAFVIGFRCGCERDNGYKRNEPQILDPIKAVKTKKEIKQQQEMINRQDELEKVMLENIDAYDGTSLGQKDLPKQGR